MAGWHVSAGAVQIHVLKRDPSTGEGGFNKSRTLKGNVTKSVASTIPGTAKMIFGSWSV
jgi:hypothetical protein